MALVTRPPPTLASKPDRVVSVIKLRKSYFGIHCIVDDRQVADDGVTPATTADGVTEASVLAFSRRFDAQKVSRWLARHRRITNLWPSRLIDVDHGLQLNAGDLHPYIPEELEGVHGLTVEEEPFSLFLRSLSVEGVALRLITDMYDDGRMCSTVFKERIDQPLLKQHLQSLMTKRYTKS